ncbi:MAG: YjgN family protein [Comamonadaceae bacterium]|nr:YjgN family protein [Comamonadaceae bacterium]
MPSARPASAPRARLPIQSHPVVFTGRGREYFRVWIVNVLLSVVTLGFYTPYARRRTAQYFYGHTLVAGSPLEFVVARPHRMLLGFALMVGLYLVYQLAVNTGQDVAALAMLAGFAVLLPFLWGSAMRFRLGATRWRGVRLAFTASWREVYLASWPVFVAAALWAALMLLASSHGLPEMWPNNAQPPQAAARWPAWPGPRATWLTGAGLGVMLLSALAFVRLEYNYRRLLVQRARVGTLPGHWRLEYGLFVRLWLATLAVGLVSAMLMATVFVALLVFFLPMSWPEFGQMVALGGILSALIMLAALVLLAVLSTLPARAYREARLFRLLWSHTGVGQVARFKSDLRTSSFVWLRLKNLLLSLLTLGLYRPFALVSEHAAKARSVTLYVRGGTDQIAGELVRQQGAFGDAVADALGLDLIG